MDITERVLFLLNRIHRTISEYFFNLCVCALRFRGDPLHIAFIADGNRTYSQQRNISRYQGYMEGMEKILHQVKVSSVLNITDLTFFLYSYHNNRRNDAEKKDILMVIEIFLKLLLSINTHYRYNIIGDASALPPNIHYLCNQLVERSDLNARTAINLAMNYSAKIEITAASQQIMKENFTEAQISVSMLDYFMRTHCTSNPDIVIRTSKQKRLSDFLTWQTVQSSLFFIDECWPEFSSWSLIKLIFCHQFFMRPKSEHKLKQDIRQDE